MSSAIVMHGFLTSPAEKGAVEEFLAARRSIVYRSDTRVDNSYTQA